MSAPMTPEIRALVSAWRQEADEREARAANPEVVGVVEREVENAAVRVLRRCADALDTGGGWRGAQSGPEETPEETHETGEQVLVLQVRPYHAVLCRVRKHPQGWLWRVEEDGCGARWLLAWGWHADVEVARQQAEERGHRKVAMIQDAIRTGGRA